MSYNFVNQEALIGATITFNADNGANAITPTLVHNFVDVVSLDGLDGSPVTPTAGTYEITVQDMNDGGFKSITDNGSLDATKTGGTGLADGVQIGASFLGNPVAIKIVPTGVDVAVAYRVSIKQNVS
jgi:hypothetical protein